MVAEKRPFRTTRTLASLRQGRNDWYKIRSQAGGPAQLLIYDEISWFGITAEQLVSELAQITGDLEVHINSPGGDTFDGIAIMNALRQHQGQVTVMVDGLAASAASVIAMAAAPGRLIMNPGSMMMIHNAWGMSIGNASDMRQMADLLDQVSGNIADIYAARGGGTAADWQASMNAETWYKAQEAVDAGLADKIREASDPAAALGTDNSWDLSVFSNGPGRKSAERVLGIESMPVEAKAIAVHHTATVDTPWDGPAAVAAMPAEYADLHYCHAWQTADADSSSHTPGDGDEDDKKGNFKFPHHKTEGGPANLAGCRNGLARLSGADIPDADRAGVKAHLQAHLDDGQGDDTGNHADLPAWLQQDAKEA